MKEEFMYSQQDKQRQLWQALMYTTSIDAVVLRAETFVEHMQFTVSHVACHSPLTKDVSNVRVSHQSPRCQKCHQ